MYAEQITFRLEKELLNALERAARQQLRSVSGMIRVILADNVPRYDTGIKPENR